MLDIFAIPYNWIPYVIVGRITCYTLYIKWELGFKEVSKFMKYEIEKLPFFFIRLAQVSVLSR